MEQQHPQPEPRLGDVVLLLRMTKCTQEAWPFIC